MLRRTAARAAGDIAINEQAAIGAAAAAQRWSMLRVSAFALVITVSVSATLFGLYILAFYLSAALDGEMARWNEVLPRLYEPDSPAATTGIGIHFAAGGIILVLGCVQLIGRLRRRVPALHRWLGRVYVAAALLAGGGGLAFIVAKGTVGGPVMDIGFGLYGALTILAALQTWRHGRARRQALHRTWAIRLFALAIGSWLYRMDYGFWLMLTGGLGHAQDFSGPFDRAMAFFFYVPNLVVAELFIRGRRNEAGPVARAITSTGMLLATAMLVVGTYFFTRHYWGPAIIAVL
jgi:hypothetical protein